MLKADTCPYIVISRIQYRGPNSRAGNFPSAGKRKRKRSNIDNYLKYAYILLINMCISNIYIGTYKLYIYQELFYSSVQSPSRVQLFATPWTARQASLSIINSQSLLKLMSIRWCHPTISSSVFPFSSHHQSFPASGSFLRKQYFASGGQSTRVSALASVLPMNIQDWFPLGWTGWISLLSKGVSSPLAPQFKSIIRWRSDFFTVQVSHPYLTTGKTTALTRWTFVGKVMSLLLNML